MNTLLRSPYIKVLCCYLALFMAGLIPFPEAAWASFISNQPGKTNELDPESLDILQTKLENKLIEEKLSELGLSSEEIIHRIEQLSPEERQIVLNELKTVEVGGNIYGPLILLLIIIAIKDFINGMRSLSGLPKISWASKKISFHKNTSWDFLPYKGEVRILVREKPEFNWIHVGSFSVRLKTSEKLHEWIKGEAAKYGADTAILDPHSPVLKESGLLYWRGKAYRTPKMGNPQ